MHVQEKHVSWKWSEPLWFKLYYFVFSNKTWPEVIDGREFESEVDFNQLFIWRMWASVDERWITDPYTPCLHILLRFWKKVFYENELSESIDERYLLVTFFFLLFSLATVFLIRTNSFTLKIPLIAWLFPRLKGGSYKIK